MTTMRIVEADKSDLKAILDLQYLSYQSEAIFLNDFTIQPLLQTYDEIEQEYAKCRFLKAEDENKEIIGSVRAYSDNGTTFVCKLFVHPKWQGQRIGEKLLLAIERECPAARYELFTSNKNMRSIRIYERIGYVKFKEQKATDVLTFAFFEKQARETSCR